MVVVGGGLVDAGHRVGRCVGLQDFSLGVGAFGDRPQLGLEGWFTVGGLRLIGGRLGEEVVEAAREVALEGADRALCGLAFCFFALQVGLGRRIALGAGDRDDVQGLVELAVPAAVEPVMGALA